MSSTIVATSAGDDDAPRHVRLDSPAAVVRAADLPKVLADLVLGVTGKCRLWNRERIDVARELCAHFRDGLEAGVTPDDLAGSFGDPRQAARLITRTRRRMRPLWWRSAMMTLRGVGAFVLVIALGYGVLAARFFLVSPNIHRNIAKELNAAVLATPESDRAWPVYIQAKKAFGATPEFMMSAAGEPMRPGDENWDLMSVWLDEHGSALQLLRDAAARPVIGAPYRSTTDPAYAEALAITNPSYRHDPTLEKEPANPLVIGLLLPHLGEMRRNARMLMTDAQLAASRADRERFVADVQAILGIGDQNMRERFGISQQVGVHVCDVAVGLVLEHATRPDFLTDNDLRDLAHRLSAFGGGRMSLDTSVDLLMVEDMLQRFFSDDGRGDGRFISGGDEGERVMTDFGVAKPKAWPLMRAYQPLRSVALPSRAQLTELGRQVAAASAADDAMPPWRHDERSSDQLNAELMRSGVFAAMPALESLYGGFEDGNGSYASSMGKRDIVRSRRDAALAVLAMEAYRREHGAWPASLDELVPTYLPSVPLDPFDGKPVRYVAPKTASERPLLYSVGVDGRDDRGELTMTEAGRSGVQNLFWLGAFRGKKAVTPEMQKRLDAVRGDWVLWPVPAPLKVKQ